MGIPVVIVPAGGLPVTVSTNGYGLPMTVATNGFGLAVTQAPAGGGGLAVIGMTFGPTIALSASSVLETAAVNTVVGTLSVTAGTTGSPVFVLVDSAGGKFNISGTSLRTNAALDYETATFHSITVSVTGVTPTVANATFTILVTDVVEPVILLTGTTVNENATAGTNIGVLSIGNSFTGTPVYTLVDSSSGKVAISGSNLNAAGAIDYETTPTFNITVSVSGITPVAPNKVFTVVVLDVAEAAGATWNPADKSTTITLSPDNLTATMSAIDANKSVRATVSKTTGKWFCKFTIVEAANAATIIGLCNAATNIETTPPGNGDAPAHGVGYVTSGNVIYDNGTYGGFIYGPIETYTTGDVISMAVDLTAERIWFRKNSNNWNNNVGADPATGTAGFDISGAIQGDAFFIAAGFSTSIAGVGDITLDASGTGAPSGFAGWGGGATTTTKNIVTDYSAVGDAQWAQATLSISTNILTSATPVWTSASSGSEYIGKSIVLPTPSFGSPHLSTISGWTSSTSITLATPTSFPFSGLDGIVAWGTDSTASFQAFKTAYQGQAVTLTVPAGKYLIKAGNFGGLFDGIRNITCNATGATICGALFQIQSSAQYQASGYAARTASVTAGATFVTLLTPSQVSRFTVGNYAMMSGQDLQMSGYPTNHSLFEYLKIIAIDGDTFSPTYGKITFLTPLTKSYLSTWPVYNSSGADYGGPATLYAMDPKFDHTSVVNGLTVAQHNQYGVSGLDLTFNNCTFAGTGQIGPHATMAKNITFTGCTATGLTQELDKLVTNLTFTGCTWSTFSMQSVAIDLLTIDSTTLTSFVGSARKTVVRNSSNFGLWAPGPGFFGYGHELTVSNSVISSFNQNGGGAIIKGATSANNGLHVDLTMSGGVMNIPAAIRTAGSAQWAVSGEKAFFYDGGTLGSFTITNVADGAGGSVDVTTDWAMGHFPTRTYNPANGLFLLRHPAPLCTFTNVTGCPEVVDLCNATAAGQPLNSYTKRTFTGSTDTAHYLQMWGRIKKIVVTVTTAYTGSIGTVTATLEVSGNQPVKMSDRTNAATWNPVINLKTAGVRTFDATAGTYPVNWTGGVTGDTLPNQTEGLWCTGNFRTHITDVSSSPGSPPMVFSVEVITDQA